MVLEVEDPFSVEATIRSSSNLCTKNFSFSLGLEVKY